MTKMKKKSQQFIEQPQVDNKELNGNKVTDVVNTPFTIVELKNDIIIAMGKDAVCTGFNSREDAENYINEKPWQLMLTAAAIYTNHINKIMDKKNKEYESKRKK